ARSHKGMRKMKLEAAKNEHPIEISIQHLSTLARAPRPERAGVIFTSPATGTVMSVTAACFPIESQPTPISTLVLAVGSHRWDEGNGLNYWVNGESPPVPAVRCTCNAGDLISWFTAATPSTTSK